MASSSAVQSHVDVLSTVFRASSLLKVSDIIGSNIRGSVDVWSVMPGYRESNVCWFRSHPHTAA